MNFNLAILNIYFVRVYVSEGHFWSERMPHIKNTSAKHKSMALLSWQQMVIQKKLYSLTCWKKPYISRELVSLYSTYRRVHQWTTCFERLNVLNNVFLHHSSIKVSKMRPLVLNSLHTYDIQYSMCCTLPSFVTDRVHVRCDTMQIT